ncbi:MAG: family 10 glycosylhydrolase [Bacteroidales bacterium]|nr:family 10 glycosylhydrolase [Bacteroidales bacterium]
MKKIIFCIVTMIVCCNVSASDHRRDVTNFRPKTVKEISNKSEINKYKCEHSGNSSDFTRGVWMWGSSIPDNDIQSVINILSKNDINKVYLLVKGTAGTRIAENKLTDFITKAHEKKIEVHLWYIINSDKAYVTANLNSCVYHCPKPSVSIKPYPANDEKVNLLYPGYKEYVSDNIRYFLEKFNCDGLHLDCIRYSSVVYSFDHYSLQKAASLGCDTKRLLSFFDTDAKYEKNTAKNGLVDLYLNGDKDIVKWVEMRKRVIYDYISTAKEIVRQVKPGIRLSAAFMPEGALDPGYGDVFYAQNYSLHSQLLDMISPMAYFKSFGKPTSWLQAITEGAKKLVAPGCEICTGIQASDDVSDKDMEEQIQNSLKGGSGGIIVFRYGSVNTDESWKIIKNSGFNK